MICNQLQEKVYAIASFISLFSLFIGIYLVVYGINVEMTIVAMILNISITGVLFNGVKRKDTTHIFIWLVFSVIEAIFSTILTCYFAIESDSMFKKYNILHKNHTYLSSDKTLEELSTIMYIYLAFSAAFGLLTVGLLSALFIVKKFYDDLLRRGNYRSYGR